MPSMNRTLGHARLQSLAYDAEKRAALDRRARTLTKILEPQEAGTVVSFEERT